MAKRPKVQDKSSKAENSPRISGAQIGAVHRPHAGSSEWLLEIPLPVPVIGRPYLVSKDDLDRARRVNDHLAPRRPAVRAVADQPATVAANRATTVDGARYVFVTPREKGRSLMGRLDEEITGDANEAGGKVTQDSGNPKTRAEGRMQEEKGELEKDKVKLEGAIGNDV